MLLLLLYENFKIKDEIRHSKIVSFAILHDFEFYKT
jgi:hypothetical protein